MATITDTAMVRIDAAADAHRAVDNILSDGGFSGSDIRHAYRVVNRIPCPDHCVVCRHTVVHANCLGCPDC
ncbi:hypothetical protein ACFVRU_03670 [Streptomyces sp. NPDC057927]